MLNYINKDETSRFLRQNLQNVFVSLGISLFYFESNINDLGIAATEEEISEIRIKLKRNKIKLKIKR